MDLNEPIENGSTEGPNVFWGMVGVLIIILMVMGLIKLGLVWFT